MNEPSARHVLPEFTERTSMGHRTLDPYSKLLDERIVFLGTPIDDTSAMRWRSSCTSNTWRRTTTSRCTSTPRRLVQRDDGDLRHDAVRQLRRGDHLPGAGRVGRRRRRRRRAGQAVRAAGGPVLIDQPSLPEPVQGQASDLALQAEELMRTRRLLEDMLVGHTGRVLNRSPPTLSGTRSWTLRPRWRTDWWATGSSPAARPRAPRPVRGTPHPTRGDPPTVPELPRCPALTRAEAELIDRYLDVVDLLGRINPARPETPTVGCGPPRRWSPRPPSCGTPSR